MRWTKAIRVQLTAWYSLALFGILLIFSLGVDWFFARNLRTRLDHDLENVLDVIALSLNHEMEEHGSIEAGVNAFRTMLATMHRTSFPHHGIAVYDGPRLIGGKAGEDVPLPTAGTPAPEGVRAAARLVRVDVVERTFLVNVNQSTRQLEEELQGFRSILFAGIPLMLLPAVAGGWILASRTLAPVMDMAARVEKISSENLHERLPPAPADDELGKLTGTFNRLLERLEGAFEQQRRFVADASHELRTPVSIALTSAQTTLEQPTRAEFAYRDALTTIERQMTRLSRIVRDLFLMARADGGRLEIEQRPFYFDEVIDDAARAARVIAHKKGVELLTGPVPEACGHGDDGLIRQLLLILLENAVKFTPAGGRVSIESSFAGESIVFRVKDTGCGIDPDHQPHIFERFFRGGSEPGTGLGLSIAHWIATAHHGQVELEASSPRGSVFRVQLPASPAVEPASID